MPYPTAGKHSYHHLVVVSFQYNCLYDACRLRDLSTKLLHLHEDVDEGTDVASTQSDGTCAATLTALPGTAHSLPASLPAAGSSYFSLPTTPRPATISPRSSSAPLNGMPNVCDTDSSSHSGSESYSSISTASSGSHHKHRLDSFPTHAQHPQHAQHSQHAGTFDFSAMPQQRQQVVAGLSCDSSLINPLPDAVNHHCSPTPHEETGALPATSAEVSSRADPQADATAELTAQHIRQRYPHLFGCNPTLLQSASHAADGTTREPDPSSVLCTAAGRTASAASSSQGASPTVLSGSSTVSSGSSAIIDTPAGAADEAAACSAALVSQGQGCELRLTVGFTGALRAGQTAVQQGLHAAALHDSPLRLLLKESGAALEGGAQAGMQATLPVRMICCQCYCKSLKSSSKWV